MHAGRKVALLSLDPWPRRQAYAPFNYAVRRVQAALLAAAIPGVEVTLVETDVADADALFARLDTLAPDVVGASAYVWSFPTFVEVAARLKRARPETTIVFGGPSARAAMFELAPYRDRRRALDALVLSEGEEVFPEIVRLASRDPDALAAIPGLALPTPLGFRSTGPAVLPRDLDALPSPYAMGLVPPGVSGHFETFRGCPLSCAFCQWGEGGGASRAFSRETIARDLEAIRALGSAEAMLTDAALNLNPRAFRNLAAAEREVRAFRDVALHAEIYPSHVGQEHLDFLSSARLARLGVGLQSYDVEVLWRLERPFDPARFERVVRDLAAIGAEVEIELILGLPGDSPDTFLRTLDRARALPASVRVYRCMVLPDALMTRAPAWSELRFDPETLLLESAAGWRAADLHRTAGALGREIVGSWFFPRAVGAAAPPSGRVGLAPEAVAAVAAHVARASRGHFAVDGVEREGAVVLVHTRTAGGPLVVELRDARAAERSFRTVAGVAVSYRAVAGPPSHADLEALAWLATRTGPLLRRLCGLEGPSL